MSIKGYNCTTCKHPGDIHESPCDECLFGSNWERKPITNADRIRAMTVEEIVAFFCNHCKNTPDEVCETLNGCDECLLAWLRQEATE